MDEYNRLTIISYNELKYAIMDEKSTASTFPGA